MKLKLVTAMVIAAPGTIASHGALARYCCAPLSNQPGICRTVFRRERGGDGLRSKARKAPANLIRCEFLNVETKRPGLFGKATHVDKADGIEDQSQMSGGAELNIAAQQCLCSPPKGQRPACQVQLQKMAPAASDIAK